jgi:hypothetical protein
MRINTVIKQFQLNVNIFTSGIKRCLHLAEDTPTEVFAFTDQI